MRRQFLPISGTVLVALTLVIAGCGKKEEPKSAAPPPATAQAPQPAPAPQATPAPASPPQQPEASQSATTEPSAAGQATATSSAPASASGKALATADGETPGFRVELQEMKRSGGTLTLRFVMINESDQEFDTHRLRGPATKTWKNVSGVHLVDNANKKKYLVVVDSEKNCVCSSDIENLKPKSRMNAWARFPAPPDDVKKVTVVVPHFLPMDDVPIGG